MDKGVAHMEEAEAHTAAEALQGQQCEGISGGLNEGVQGLNGSIAPLGGVAWIVGKDKEETIAFLHYPLWINF